jgi:uncharacterized coiled-coil DUF342 family protein
MTSSGKSISCNNNLTIGGLKMTKNQSTRIKNKIRKLTDVLGDLKEDRNLIRESIADMTDEIKNCYKSIKTNELSGAYYRSVFDEYEKENVDWKSLALSFKPTKRRIKKFTTTEKIERLKTFQLDL